MPDSNPTLTFGPNRVFVPVCVRHPSPYGLLGGPSGYEERAVGEKGECPVVLDKLVTYVTPRGGDR